MVRLEHLRAKKRRGFGVWKIGAVDAFVKLPSERAVAHRTGRVHSVGQRIPIPFRIWVLVLDIDRGKGGNGIHAPVNEDAELRIRVPARNGTAVERSPGRLI